MSFEIWVQGNKNTKKQCFHLGVDDETDPGDGYKENAGNINLEGKDDESYFVLQKQFRIFMLHTLMIMIMIPDISR